VRLGKQHLLVPDEKRTQEVKFVGESSQNVRANRRGSALNLKIRL